MRDSVQPAGNTVRRCFSLRRLAEIMNMTAKMASSVWAGTVLGWDKEGRTACPEDTPAVILICEHASNRMVSPWCGASPELLASHAAVDIGALGLSKALAPQLARACGGAELIHAPFSRLIYDLNRSPDRPDACPVQSEIHHVALNEGLSDADRLARMERLYLPFHDLVRARISRALVLGQRPVILTIHSFAPVWHGVARKVEFGVIHDAQPALAQAIVAMSQGLGLVTELNAPYSAEDHVTHTLRLQALPYGLQNAMLELRNDLIGSSATQQDMAARLAPVLIRAVAQVTEASCPAS